MAKAIFPVASARRRFLKASASNLMLWALVRSSTAEETPAIRVAPGPGSFVFADSRGDPARALTVYTYLPTGIDVADAPIVFVLHGHHRTAAAYRDTWKAQSDRYGFLVLAPLFDIRHWGHGLYSYASVLTNDGHARDASLWSFSVIEHLFDAVRAATGSKAARYFIFGFSEGGQFVHRLVWLLPEARYARAVIGTPGWYTMPRFDVRYPYGLGGAPVTEANLRTSLARDVVLMLGDADVDPHAPDLRTTREAMVQGSNRYERGLAFFKEVEQQAALRKVALGWRLHVVNGAAHEPSKLAAPAAARLMG